MQIIKNLTQKSQTSDICISSPPNDTAKTFVMSQLTTPLLKQNKVIFWLCQDNKEAQSIYENLKFWQTIDKNKTKIQLINPENPTQLSIINYQLLSSQKTIILISTFDNLNSLELPAEFSKRIITIKNNQTLNPQILSQKLIRFGYNRNTTADQPGTFSVHGEIINIWTPQFDKPTKIEFEYNKISNISIEKKKIQEIDIIPLTMKQCRNKTIKQLNNTTIVASDPNPSILKKFSSTPKIIFQSLSSSIINYQLLIIDAPLYHNNLSSFTSDLKKYQGKNYKIIIATNQKKSLEQLFKEKNVNLTNYLITQLPSYLITGFVSKSLDILFLTDHEIFGRGEAVVNLELAEMESLSERSESKVEIESKASSRQQCNNVTIQQFNNIKPGDFVVHEDHGIAIYQGITAQSIDNIKKEFFLLQYKDNDKLYVPVELADKIDRYLGLANPPIHRLHGGMWSQIRKKIKEQAEIVAKELLELYAKREIAHAIAFGAKTPEEKELENSFPYEETPDQLKTIREVENGLMQKEPMDRLVCGDVGFGKTEVAIRAAFKTVMNNCQVALLAPTTILVQQHYDTFINRLKNFPVNIGVLSRFESKSAQKKTITKAKNGLIDILIGTHRLLSKDIKFKNLGLIIIDEEQRFGVEHKEKLKKLRANAHILTLTATPIPRTLNFALSNLRDISVIETPPPGRQKIKTIIEQYNEPHIKKAIQTELSRKGQIYFVHNQVETIQFAAKKISKLVPKAKVAIAHGQMPENKLAQVMSDFDNKKTDVLICSTIIENGLDLPNVNTIIVDNATKFGLSQLYQLRGRVGRSNIQAYAYFFYQRLQNSNVPVSKGKNKDLPPEASAKGGNVKNGLTQKELARLQALKQAEELGSGFQLAIRDMEIRGVGSILGKKQHGSVAAIGLSLYARLLSNAVEKLKTGITPPPIPEITIDLPLEIGIPKEFEPNEVKRLNLYQHLANITDLAELIKEKKNFISRSQKGTDKNIRDNISEKYSRNISPPRLVGEAGEKFNNLFYILEIKLLAQKTNIISIDTSLGLSISGERKKKINIKFKEPINQGRFQKLLSTQPYWKQSPNQIKINLEDLEKNWVNKLKQCIMIFSNKKTDS